MRPIKFEGYNALFGAADGWDEKSRGAVGTLCVRREYHPEPNLITCTSMWKPSKEELALLNAGGSVALTCAGGQPTVMMDVVFVNEYPDLVSQPADLRLSSEANPVSL